MKNTLKLVWVLVEMAAAIRAGLATATVVYIITDSNVAYTLFTVLIVEGVFVAALFSMQDEAVAPIAALLALAFSGAMQWLELVAVADDLTTQDKFILRGVVAFAPIVILALAYLRRLVPDETLREVVATVTNAVKPQREAEDKPTSPIAPKTVAVLPEVTEISHSTNGKKQDFS